MTGPNTPYKWKYEDAQALEPHTSKKGMQLGVKRRGKGYLDLVCYIFFDSFSFTLLFIIPPPFLSTGESDRFQLSRFASSSSQVP
jgi:hypothetical protein